MGSVPDVKLSLEKFVSVVFVLTDNNPIIWRCSKEHAKFYKRFFSRQKGFEISFISGSIANGQKIVNYEDTSLEENDEQIIMLSKIKEPSTDIR